jgi:hypothetical protein
MIVVLIRPPAWGGRATCTGGLICALTRIHCEAYRIVELLHIASSLGSRSVL